MKRVIVPYQVSLGNIKHSSELQWLACGPNVQASCFTTYNVNGFKFRTLSREEGLKTQNSGVHVTSDTRSYASKRDSNVAVGGVSYYEKLMDIIELNYSGQFTVILFRWARLVYYVDDEVDKEWSVIVHVKPRDLFDMGDIYEYCEVELSPQQSQASKRKVGKTIEFWDVKTIESDGTIKQLDLSVKEAIKPPNGRKIVLRFNDRLQPVENEAGILSGVLGILGSDYTKFPICEKDWRKVRSRDKNYNECVKELFHFEEDSGGIIKRTILKILGRAWKDTRNHLYHHFYKLELTLEQNIKGRPLGITVDHWRWYLDYRNSEETKEKCRKKAVNQSKQLYTHTGGSKSLSRLEEEESKRQGRPVSRGELFVLTHKRSNGSYLHDAPRAIGERIAEIEQHDESSRLLSQNDSLAQALGKEQSGRVRGMGIRPTTSQVFDTNSH
ncbi:uncharacterized protein LOC110269282 [Arachis ipaensis]|uniref:uncharacterized protein LOC110269282 n=1 Tax=Arachis ipaensis TaxID=130454 RepID=UPI000A2B55AA|nr:uncharacterized protein LOC110269282 [Arachis ipaensis]